MRNESGKTAGAERMTRDRAELVTQARYAVAGRSIGCR